MTGMRQGVALGLGWEDLDIERGSLSVRRTWIPVDDVAKFCQPKSRRSRRTIALSLDARSAPSPTPPAKPTNNATGPKLWRRLAFCSK